MAFHYLKVGFSKGAEIYIKVLDLGSMALRWGYGVNFLRRAHFINGDSKDGRAGESCCGSQGKSLRILGFSK